MGTAECVERALGVVETLGTVDLDALSASELDTLVVGLMVLRDRVELATCRAVSRWDALAVWAQDGSRSAASRLARDGRCSRPTAGRILRRARSLRSMPATLISFGNGELTVDYVDLLTPLRAGGREQLFDRDERVLVEQCRGLTHRDAARAVAHWTRRADAEVGGDGTRPTNGHDRSLEISAGIGGDVRLHGDLDRVGGAEFMTALQRLVDEIGSESARPRTVGQRRADALVEMARRAMAMPAGARKPRPLVSVVVGHASFVELCELGTGVMIGAGDLVPDLDALDVEQIVFDGDLRAVGVSPSRCFTGALRRIVEVRDRRCTHPSGCDVPLVDCDVDHIVPRCQGGETSQANGRLRCRFHNRIEPQQTRPPPP
jgi:hypothetical protein